MRVMGVDYGDVRTGLCVSDAMGLMAGEAWTVTEPNPEKLADIIKEEAGRRQVGLLILGRPLNMDGSAGPRA